MPKLVKMGKSRWRPRPVVSSHMVTWCLLSSRFSWRCFIYIFRLYSCPFSFLPVLPLRIIMEYREYKVASISKQEPGQYEGIYWTCKMISHHGPVQYSWEAVILANGDRSLYIQALTTMQRTPENELLSWFQVAGRSLYASSIKLWELMAHLGIHGRPYISWDNIEWNPSAPEVGYCPHSSTLFTTVRCFHNFLPQWDHSSCCLHCWNGPWSSSTPSHYKIKSTDTFFSGIVSTSSSSK